MSEAFPIEEAKYVVLSNPLYVCSKYIDNFCSETCPHTRPHTHMGACCGMELGGCGPCVVKEVDDDG